MTRTTRRIAILAAALVALAPAASAQAGQNSSAVVSLGKLGRVEAAPQPATAKGSSAVVSLGKLGRVE